MEPTRKQRILVVDDEPSIVDAVATSLRYEGFEVTEAVNGRLEHLRGSALGFRNLTNYITRCLLETGGFRPQLHPRL